MMSVGRKQRESHRISASKLSSPKGEGTVDVNYNILCGSIRTHYVEYLGLLIWQHHLDPISILSSDDLETIVKRAHKKLPAKPYGIKDVDYRPLLLKVIMQNYI